MLWWFRPIFATGETQDRQCTCTLWRVTKGNETVAVVCPVDLDVIANNITILSIVQNLFLCGIYVAGSNKTYLGLHVKCPILTKFGVYRQILMNSPVSNLTEIRPVGAVHIYADRRADMTKLIGAFRDCEPA